MSLPVHLVPTLAGVTVGSVVEVTGDEAHHAVVVRRLRVGEHVALTDGVGGWAVGPVVATDKRTLEVGISSVETLPRPEPDLLVIQALPKGDRGELAVEVLTEIGVGTIVPWAAERSVAVWRGERATKSLAKWRATAREAAKQARRASFPEVAELATTTEAHTLLRIVDLAVVLHEDAEVALADLEVPETGTIALVVGPEGGLADTEVAHFADAGAHVVRLGPEVLRTSTAGLAAAAVLLSRSPRWR